MSLTCKELVSSILIPSSIIAVLLVGTLFIGWKADMDRRAEPIRREIAQNFLLKWGRPDIAAKWDKNIICKEPTMKQQKLSTAGQ